MTTADQPPPDGGQPGRRRAMPGAGRRAVDGSTQVERVTITLTAADRVRLRELGGSPWVRSRIRAATDDPPGDQTPAKMHR